MNQSAIIQSAQHGDLDSFNQLVLAYQDRVFNIAVWMLESEDCAADAVQNAFILAFRKIGSFYGGSFDFWLLRIIKNVCYDELRRRKRQQTTPLEPLIEEDEFDTPTWLNDHSQNMDELIDAAELSDAIRAGLQMLTPKYRMVITLADVDGLEYTEVAQILGVPIGTVKSRLARARLQLRRELRRCAELLPDVYAGAQTVLMPKAVATE
jgi:RNA polymerase sigma-70 factor (ECF subfamily)